MNMAHNLALKAGRAQRCQEIKIKLTWSLKEWVQDQRPWACSWKPYRRAAKWSHMTCMALNCKHCHQKGSEASATPEHNSTSTVNKQVWNMLLATPIPLPEKKSSEAACRLLNEGKQKGKEGKQKGKEFLGSIKARGTASAPIDMYNQAAVAKPEQD